MDEHIVEAVGRTRVTIRNGEVVSVEAPVISRCPLARRFAFPVDEITPDAVRENVNNRIRSFGMCTPDRELSSTDDFVGFGASELAGTGLSAGIIDAAVIACDGAGTVVVTAPEMVQGIGGRMSGLVKTSPLQAVISGITTRGGIVADPDQASLDPVAGVTAARRAGYTRLLVTVGSADDAEAVRAGDPDSLIIVVHTTGMTAADASRVAAVADIVTACASGHVRDVCGKKALMQAGTTVPVFIMTCRGKELLIARIAVLPHPLLVTHAALPAPGEKRPDPLV